MTERHHKGEEYINERPPFEMEYKCQDQADQDHSHCYPCQDF